MLQAVKRFKKGVIKKEIEKDYDKKTMIKKILIKKKRLKKIAKNFHPSNKMILVVMLMRLLRQFETSLLFFYEKISSEQKAPKHKSIKAQKTRKAQIANKRTKTRKAAILCA